ncbi:hypothetical protein HBI42_105360 [Parastagonospora nodorum]|nr:hypothetical protein HBI43_103940 [Parastagonospora nodorum]KAH6258010.1 hypothetical protein HBI42_105360 [Parastagonospora nodorum]
MMFSVFWRFSVACTCKWSELGRRSEFNQTSALGTVGPTWQCEPSAMPARVAVFAVNGQFMSVLINGCALWEATRPKHDYTW